LRLLAQLLFYNQKKAIDLLLSPAMAARAADVFHAKKISIRR
jgi:hypothetical protein